LFSLESSEIGVKRRLEEEYTGEEFLDLNDLGGVEIVEPFIKHNKKQRESSDVKMMNPETIEKTKARSIRLESVVAQCTSSNSVKYTTFTEAIYAALKAMKTADLEQICSWIAQNSASLDPSFASRIDFNKASFKGSVRSTLHNNSVFKKEKQWNDLKSQGNGKWFLFFDSFGQ